MSVRNRMVVAYAGRLVAVAAAYAAVAKVGFELGSAGYVSAVYPAAGLAVGLLYLGGLRLWPGILAGATVLNATDHAGPWDAVPIAVAITAAAVAGAWVLSRIVSRTSPFERIRDVLGLVAASIVAPAIAATTGILVLWASGRITPDAAPELWRMWWLGDAAGVLAIAPLVIVLADLRPRPSRWDVLQAAALAGVTAAVTIVVFGDWLATYSRLYLLFPLIVWAALFKGRQSVVVIAAGVAVAASWATVHAHGPLGAHLDLEHLALLDGFIAAFIVTGLVLAGVDAQRRGAVATARELLLAERSAREDAEAASSRTREIFETISDAFVSVSRDWIVEYANEEAMRLARVAGTRVVGKTYWEVVPAVVGTVFERRFRAAMASRQPAHFEAAVPGLGLWLDVHVYPTADRLSIYFRDITRQRALEEELALSRKMEVVGRLAGGVAHDFNNLLLAIRGYGELALRRIERHDEGAATDVGEMLKAAERGADLTRQLLAVGRRQPLNTEVLDLTACLSQIEPLLRRVIGEDVELAVGCAPGPIHIRADRSQIEQVILNLAVNARDAMPDGGRLAIHLAVAGTVTAGEIPEGRVRLRVTDTGVGMSTETASRIFEPFYTTKGDRGTGLGLATVHGIVTQSGGHIEVSTELGKGTCFDIFLAVSAEKPAAVVAHSSRTDEGRETVLIVEDDPSVRLIATRLLEDRGYIAIAARGGEEAIRLAQRPSLRIDLVLSDMVMPDLSGRQTVERIRLIQPHARVLFMSGYTDEQTGDTDLLGPDASYIPKPFSGEQLARKVRDLLDWEEPT